MGRARIVVAVGVTAALGLFFLGYYTMYLMWEDLRPWRTYRASFARTIGLAKDDAVFVHGYEIGRVHQIRLAGDHQLVELQVDPSVTFHERGLRVVIQSVNSFGRVGVWVDPGDAASGPWDPGEPIPGTFRESLAASSDAQSPAALSESLRELEAFTEALTRIDSGLAGRLVNDPDGAVAIKDGFEEGRGALRAFREAAAVASSGEGFGALAARDPAQALGDAVGGTRDTIQSAREALAAATLGEPGLLGRLAGDPDAAASLRESLSQGASFLRGYAHAEGSVTGVLSRSEDGAERIAALLFALEERTGEARRGEGTLGALFGPSSGPPLRESLAGLAARLEAMTAADPEVGALFSRAPEGRRAAEDIASRVDDVVEDMRRALLRLRVDQSPNTFPGALLSVF